MDSCMLPSSRYKYHTAALRKPKKTVKNIYFYQCQKISKNAENGCCNCFHSRSACPPRTLTLFLAAGARLLQSQKSIGFSQKKQSKTLEDLCAYKKTSKKVKKHITINGENIKNKLKESTALQKKSQKTLLRINIHLVFFIIIKKIIEENKESKLLTRNLYVIAPQFTCKQASR